MLSPGFLPYFQYSWCIVCITCIFQVWPAAVFVPFSCTSSSACRAVRCQSDAHVFFATSPPARRSDSRHCTLFLHCALFISRSDSRRGRAAAPGIPGDAHTWSLCSKWADLPVSGTVAFMGNCRWPQQKSFFSVMMFPLPPSLVTYRCFFLLYCTCNCSNLSVSPSEPERGIFSIFYAVWPAVWI